jgi:uncharacterized protein with von Willebrand factor type A (vWA) domain
MNKEEFTHLLLGKDLRTIRQNSIVVHSVQDQQTFDELFRLVFHHERPLVMRAVDAVEKITSRHPEFLIPHKLQLLSVLKSADHKELKWHIAQLVPRIDLTHEELSDVWHTLAFWALNKNESKIVRVNALQGLFDLSKEKPDLKAEFNRIISAIEHEMIPSIQARIRKLRKIKR